MDVLTGISPWWWVAGAVLLAAIEMLTISTVLIWSALAALVTAIAMWIAPGLSGMAQVAIFALLSIAFTFAGRAIVQRYSDRGGDAKLNRRAEQLIGREAEVLGFRFHEGQVAIDGVPWPARLVDGELTPEIGERVIVTAADGIVVQVRRIEDAAKP